MKNARPTQNRSEVRGFSLLELLIVVVLLASMLAIVIPSLRSLTDAKVKEAVTRIAGLQSEVYAMAAISGITHRINFDLDNNNYWVEVREAGDLAPASPDLGYDELIISLRAKQKDEKDKSKRFVPQYKAAEGEFGEKYQMPKGLMLLGAWTEQLKEVARTGLVSIYFFSGGYTQASFVSVAEKGNDNENAIFVALNPLTGAVSIDYGEPTTESLLDGENVGGK